jgi:hypothetical protein
MGKALHHFGQPVPASPLDLLSDSKMQRGPRPREQALIQRVAHQRVFERIVARPLLRIDQIERLRRRERGFHVLRISHSRQELRIEAPPDHSRRLKERAVLGPKPIHARCKEALHTRRQRRRRHTGVKFHLSGVGPQNAALRQETNDLLGKERIALGLFRYELPESLRQ